MTRRFPNVSVSRAWRFIPPLGSLMVAVLFGYLAQTAQPALAGPPIQSAPTPTPTITWTERVTNGMGMLFSVPPVPTAVTRFYDQAQRQHGGELYEQWCSTCHGDVGQGLTADWRATWPEDKRNCWQSKCHASNHPPDTGFRFPRYVPPVLGEGTLVQFRTAPELFTYVQTRMPYSAPGSLSERDYWALTAFLLDGRKVAARGEVLDSRTASDIQLPSSLPTALPAGPQTSEAPAAPTTPQAQSAAAVDWRLALSGGIVFLALIGLVGWRRTR